MKLEELHPKATIRGLVPDAVATVVDVNWLGSEALELTYKTGARTVANHILCRDDEPRLQLIEESRRRSFNLRDTLSGLDRVEADPAEPGDPSQRRVVEAPAGARMLVLAGPGSGKTEVSARRLAWLLSSGLPAPAVLVLSFSRSAVRTLTARLGRMGTLDDQVVEELRHVAIRTFDSWTFRMLRRLGHPASDLLRHSYDENVALLVDLLRGQESGEIQLLLRGVRHILVDEMQDLAGVRGDLVIELLRLLAPAGQTGVGFTLLGDPCQSIYAFGIRTATRTSLHGESTTQLLGALRSIYGPELLELPLDLNHRAEPVLAAFLQKLRQVLMSPITNEDKHGAMSLAVAELPLARFALDYTLFDASRSRPTAILARTNGEVLRVAQKLFGTQVAGPGIDIQVGSGDSGGGPAWVAALLGCIRSSTLTRQQFEAILAKALAAAPDCVGSLGVPAPDVAWRRLLQAAGRDVNAPSVMMRDLAAHLNWPDAFPDDEGVVGSGLCISTIHQAKGREFDVVAILEQDSERIPENSDPEEEACVAFVALSRGAKEVVRLPADLIYPAPHGREFGHGARKRLVSWHHGWVNMEMGVPGDVVPESFADTLLHGSEDAVAENYRFLAGNARQLIGHKVMLRKVAIPGAENNRVRYEICLQDGAQPGRLLGAMSQNLVFDILGLIHSRGYSLPRIIMNLRIARVVSLTSRGGDSAVVSQLFASSGMWLGIELFGTGDFQTFSPRRRH